MRRGVDQWITKFTVPLWLLLVLKHDWTTRETERKTRDKWGMLLEPFFLFCHGLCGGFSFVTLDTHCPSTGHKSTLVFVVWVEKGLDICNKKLVVQQASGKEFYWSMGSSSGYGPPDGWEFQAPIIMMEMWSCLFTLSGSTLAISITYSPKSPRCLMTSH